MAEPAIHARLTDEQLAAEIERLELRLDQLDDAVWPDAVRQRAEVLERLGLVRAEAERRRV